MIIQSIMKVQKQVITSLIKPTKHFYNHSNLLKLCCFLFLLLAFGLTFGLTLSFYSQRFSFYNNIMHHNITLLQQTPQKLNALIITPSPPIVTPVNSTYSHNSSSDSRPTRRTRTDEDLIRMTTSMIPKTEEIQVKGVYKIAFMFLIKGSLPIAPLWEKFFKGHKGYYSIYVHSDPSFKSSHEVNTGVFHGRRIPSKEVKWGKFNMIEAELRLLDKALQDVSNKRFVLLSETCIPLFNFSTIYSYLINSTQSYVQAYDKSGPAARGRYKQRLGPFITVRDWRKGSQWFELDRDLAIEVMSDQRYFLLFKRACNNSACYADEHYLPTWMNMNAIGRNSNRSITWVDWSRGGCHPAKYRRMHVTAELLKKLRDGKTCQYNGKKTNICFLFARKFLPSTLNRLLWLAPKIMEF